ncbi:MAG: hypothetical protein K8I02_00375 [Candidatus Methylomirabilis sp.]|nr:hypothetical protein [Deltaproteobacteria bacterium]
MDVFHLAEGVSWSYAISSLAIRFVGVFVLLAAVQIALQTATALIRRYEARFPEKPPEPPKKPHRNVKKDAAKAP